VGARELLAEGPGEPTRGRRGRRLSRLGAGLLLLLLAVELLDELVFGAREAALPLIRDDLSLSYAQVGVLLAVPNAASMVIEPGIGILGDVWRRRALVVGGGIVYGLALALVAASSSYAMLLVAFVVMYPATGAFVSLAQASLMDLDVERREENMVRWTIAGSVGALAGPGFVAVAAFADAGWRPVFAGLAALTLGLSAVTLVRLPPSPRADGPARAGLRAAWRAATRPAVLRWLFLLEAADLLLDVLLGFLALYFVDEVGLGRGTAAVVVGAFLGAGLVGNFVVLRLLRSVSGLRYLRASAVLAGLLFAAFLLLPGAALKLTVVLALAAVNAGWYPVLKARLYTELPGRSGTAMSLGSLLGPLGILAPLGVGLVAEHAGLDAALWLLMFAPAALVALVPRTSPA
jgi:MFS transporter, FSR family, fosmidomycin resistance protein